MLIEITNPWLEALISGFAFIAVLNLILDIRIAYWKRRVDREKIKSEILDEIFNDYHNPQINPKENNQ